MWNKKNTICEVKKLIVPPQAGGDLATLGKYAGRVAKKAAEMARFFASEWLREPGTQEMIVRKVNPFFERRN